jgi:glycerophosphoryl diester phosphodiesterase
MEIIAHRGASHDAPENTLAAVHLAWQQGADAVEVDVQLSKDGRLVVIHDDNTKRSGGFSRKVGAQTLDELRRLDVGRWKGQRWAGERIPTLAAVLATVPDAKRLFVEFKCGPAGVPEFKRVAKDAGKRPGLMVAIGFSRETMRLLKAEMPALEVCWISKLRRHWRTGRWLPAAEKLIAAAQKIGVDGLDLDARSPVNSALVEKLRTAGLKLYVWTVDSPAKAKQLVAAGVDGITTNRPGWLREHIQRVPTKHTKETKTE